MGWTAACDGSIPLWNTRSSASFFALIQLTANALEVMGDGSRAWARALHVQYPDGILGSWIFPGLIQVVVAIWGVTQWVKHLCFFTHSLCNSFR